MEQSLLWQQLHNSLKQHIICVLPNIDCSLMAPCQRGPLFFWLSHPKINLRPRNDIINSFSSSHAHSCPLHISLWLWTGTHSPLLVSTNRVYFSTQQWWKKKDYSLSHNDKWVQYTCVLPTNQQSSHACIKSHCMHYLMLFFLKKTMLVIFSGFEFF